MQCNWFIAASAELDPALWYFIDNQKFPSEIRSDSGIQGLDIIGGSISPTPRDIQRQSEPEEYEVSVPSQHKADPSWRTQKGRVNLLSKTKRQLKAERKRLLEIEKRKYGIEWFHVLRVLFDITVGPSRHLSGRIWDNNYHLSSLHIRPLSIPNSVELEIPLGRI